MKALILAGGLGNRMGKITEIIPKSMIRINKKPVIEYQIELLKRYGLKEIIICTGYLSKDIEDYFKEFPKKKVNVKVEDTLDFGGKWLHHQRADLFLPGHKVKWILTAGSYCWTFGTKFVKRKIDE